MIQNQSLWFQGWGFIEVYTLKHYSSKSLVYYLWSRETYRIILYKYLLDMDWLRHAKYVCLFSFFCLIFFPREYVYLGP